MAPDKELEMQVDRPLSPVITLVGGKGAGKKVIAQYSWGETNDPLPIKVGAIVEDSNGIERIIGVAKGPFESLEHAVEEARAIAADWYERGNV